MCLIGAQVCECVRVGESMCVCFELSKPAVIAVQLSIMSNVFHIFSHFVFNPLCEFVIGLFKIKLC